MDIPIINFIDPITFDETSVENGILLDTKYYSLQSMRTWVRRKNTVPHSRRELTDEERDIIGCDEYSDDDDESIYDTDDELIEEIETLDRTNIDLQDDDTSGGKEFSTFELFQIYIEGLENEMETKGVGEIDKKITITSRPSFIITLNATARVELVSTQRTSRFLSTWTEMTFKITKNSIDTEHFGMDVFVRDYVRGVKGPVKISPAKLTRTVEKSTREL